MLTYHNNENKYFTTSLLIADAPAEISESVNFLMLDSLFYFGILVWQRCCESTLNSSCNSGGIISVQLLSVFDMMLLSLPATILLCPITVMDIVTPPKI